LNSARVLIVEDENAFGDVVADLLAEEGYAVVRAHDGPNAINMLDAPQMSPDVVVCDVKMPGLRGDRFAAEVRRRFPRRRLPILLLSAQADPRVRLRDVWFMSKPVDIKDLLKTIACLVEPLQGAVAHS